MLQSELMVGDIYIGRGFGQRSLPKSWFCDIYKISQYGRTAAIEHYCKYLSENPGLRSATWTLTGCRLLCHCTRTQDCHADALIGEFKRQFPSSYDRIALGQPRPSARIMTFIAELRCEPESDEVSTADEGAPQRGAGFCGRGRPMQVGLGCTARDFCDGQSLASPGRWAPEDRNYPETKCWFGVVDLFRKFTETFTSAELLVRLSLGKVSRCRFSSSSISELKKAIVDQGRLNGYELRRAVGDWNDVPIDFLFMGLILRIAGDPEIGLGEYSQGARVGPGVRMSRLPALYRPKRHWRLPEQADPLSTWTSSRTVRASGAVICFGHATGRKGSRGPP